MSPSSPAGAAEVRATLERMLASPAFRNSKQAQKFLRHVVESALNGQEDLLRERTLGIDVFGRAPDYDTGEDPIVRVRATELRKRIAQYYQESAQPGDVRIDVPAGHYRPEFQTVQAPAAAGPPPPLAAHEGQRPKWWFVVALAVIASALLLWRKYGATDIVGEFWSPVLEHSQPVLIYCGQPTVYFLKPELREKYRGSPLPPDLALKGEDVLPVTDQFVGIGNAHTAASLAGLFARRGKGAQIRYANDISFSDVRAGPAVLIGGFSNLWTMELTRELRFVFEQAAGARVIRDRSTGKIYALPKLEPDGKTPEDYAVVARLVTSPSGQPVVAAAGITQYGTRAAGEFLSDAGRLREALERAPEDWARRSQQFLLHTAVYKGTPAPPRLLAVEFR